jgi:hypothetical protein
LSDSPIPGAEEKVEVGRQAIGGLYVAEQVRPVLDGGAEYDIWWKRVAVQRGERFRSKGKRVAVHMKGSGSREKGCGSGWKVLMLRSRQVEKPGVDAMRRHRFIQCFIRGGYSTWWEEYLAR